MALMASFKDKAWEVSQRETMSPVLEVSHSDGQESPPMDDPGTKDVRQTRGRYSPFCGNVLVVRI